MKAARVRPPKPPKEFKMLPKLQLVRAIGGKVFGGDDE